MLMHSYPLILEILAFAFTALFVLTFSAYETSIPSISADNKADSDVNPFPADWLKHFAFGLSPIQTGKFILEKLVISANLVIPCFS